MVRNQKDQTRQTGQVRKQLVWAGPCTNPRVNGEPHKNTRVYSKHGERRYCVCDLCGHTWWQDGPVAGDEAEEAESSNNAT